MIIVEHFFNRERGHVLLGIGVRHSTIKLPLDLKFRKFQPILSPVI